jgi:hypothetical protein
MIQKLKDINGHELGKHRKNSGKYPDFHCQRLINPITFQPASPPPRVGFFLWFQIIFANNWRLINFNNLKLFINHDYS